MVFEGNLLHAFIAALFSGFVLPFMVLRFLRSRRQKKFAAQFPDAIDIIVRSLRAGHPVPIAINMVARELGDPIGSEFGTVTDEITYGAETQLSTINTYSSYDTSPVPTTGRDRLTGYYGQWQSTLAQQLTLTGGLRYDDDQEFGGHTSYKLAGAWRLGDGATVLRANYGNGFKAPTLYQLFSSYSDPLASLQPEKATGWEVGLDHDLLDKRVRASLTYFSRSEHDLIDFDQCFTSDPGCVLRPLGYYFNVDRAHVRGVETGLLAHPAGGWSAWLNYTNLTAIDELTGLDLARRPHVTGNAGLSWSSKTGSSLGASYGYTGARFDDAANTVPLVGAENVSVYGSYGLGGGSQLLVRIDNLFKNRSEPAAGYGYLGQAIYAGVRLAL
jgi:vitamin B12 transporter